MAGFPLRHTVVMPDRIIDAVDQLRLRLLVELGRRGSISAAADACRMGQPSATKHLHTLEAAVGERLVERAGRASRLTEAGEIVAAHGARVLDTLDAMQQELRGCAAPSAGRLRWPPRRRLGPMCCRRSCDASPSA